MSVTPVTDKHGDVFLADGPRMPRQQRGRSKQDYGTPPEFIEAVKRDFALPYGFTCDLAASAHNAIVPDNFVSKETDSLAPEHLWHALRGPLWLNPPFEKIAPWVRKAYHESELGARVFVLVPASVGSNWWRDWVHEKANVQFLNGRIKFVGAEDVYPKDLALLIYERERAYACYNIWSWQRR